MEDRFAEQEAEARLRLRKQRATRPTTRLKHKQTFEWVPRGKTGAEFDLIPQKRAMVMESGVSQLFD